jgi:hypothetical protein
LANFPFEIVETRGENAFGAWKELKAAGRGAPVIVGPAHLHWGSWNACPAPQYHAAALRYWRDAHGAELVGLGSDTIDLKVPRKPTTRDEAIELARIHYAYCADIVDQGTGSYSVLAAELMAHDWWFLWWD